MASYAPLFAHVDAWQWTPNLIWFDNLRSYGTPSYYVQKLFGQNKGTTVLPVTIDRRRRRRPSRASSPARRSTQATGDVIVKLVNPGPAARDVALTLNGVTPAPAAAASR